MSFKQLSRFVSFVVLALSISLLAGVNPSAAQDGPAVQPGTMVVEVAEDGNRFVFDDLNLFEDGMPGYGSAFVTQGYVYPVGTLNGSNGVLDNGEPEFPEQVLGTWTCYGWLIGDGAHTETGA